MSDKKLATSGAYLADTLDGGEILDGSKVAKQNVAKRLARERAEANKFKVGCRAAHGWTFVSVSVRS